ncbi:MAG TPA: ankyrin repeat domain-containing protein, partial [Herpetosiphonaceae bacterium]|nr:ankyrin repeat domain-containing protein [Herpetosiphonaceae bacterium]
MVRFLLAQGADANARSWTPETAAEAGASTLSEDYARYQFSGDTALTLAASTGDLEIVRCLLDAGADVDAATTAGYAALHNAIYSLARHAGGAADLVALLLERGATLNQATSGGQTPLQIAAGLADFDVVRLLLAAGVDPAPLRWTRLMHAVVFGSLGDVRAHLDAGAELEAVDTWDRTALHLSFQVGDLDKAGALLDAGAVLDGGGPDGGCPLTYAIVPSHPAVLVWLLAQGCDPEAPNWYGQTPLVEAVQAGAVDAVRVLLEAGARADRVDTYGQQVITDAQDLEIVHLLLAHGADINAVSDDMRVRLFGIAGGDPLNLSRTVYLAGKAPRFGAANPEVMDVPFWHAMVRSRISAYEARQRFYDTESDDDTPVWCCVHFGRTLTALPDGRYVEIAGEHEDYYDRDFCIYNDAIVYDGAGTFTLYGYPEEVFPPTDFHSATLAGAYIYLIGSAGYRGTRRVGETPVYRLALESWRIERVATHGEQPGWISRHTAAYDAASRQIVVRGGQRFVSEHELVDNEAVYAL